MNLTHHLRVSAPLPQAWAVFSRLDALAPCLPGASVDRRDGDEFSGSLRMKFGPTSLDYRGSGRSLKRDRTSRVMRWEAAGTDRRGHGTARATITATFEDAGPDTEIAVAVALDLTGRPALFGRGVVSEAIERWLDQVAGCLSSRLAAGLGADLQTDPIEANRDPRLVEGDDEEDLLEPTTELGADLGDIDEPDPAPRRAAPPYPYRPPTVAPVAVPSGAGLDRLPALARRYGPLLGALGLVLAVVLRLRRRRG